MYEKYITEDPVGIAGVLKHHQIKFPIKYNIEIDINIINDEFLRLIFFIKLIHKLNLI